VSDTAVVVLLAAGCAASVGLVAAGVLRVWRAPSLRATLAVTTTAAVLAVVAGVVASAQAMFLSPHDLDVVLVVCLVAGVVAAGFGVLVARRVVGESRDVRAAAGALADEHRDGSRRATPRTAELADILRELDATRDRLDRARERERALETSRRELVAWVSHDLRTPLAGLRAMAEALEDGVVDDTDRYLKQMRVEVDRLSGMVDDLFELSRLHSGTVRTSEDPVALHDLVSDALAGAEPLAVASGVRLTGDASPRLTVAGDSRELGRALANLVVNAVRHTPPEGAVHVAAAADGDGRALLAVQDACGGIAEDDLPKVFDVAWRGTHARTPGPDGGAGLGLAIVRGIVEAHGGTADVANVAEGCRFEVHLPLRGDGESSVRVARRPR
jgi:signal transduction histidine kinase